MTENLIAEIRQLLEEIVLPELKALMAKLDDFQRQIALRDEALAMFSAELDAVRAEMAALRTEVVALRGGDASSEPVKRVKAGRYVM